MSTGFPVNSNAPLRTGVPSSKSGMPATMPDGQAGRARGTLRPQHPVPALHAPAVKACFDVYMCEEHPHAQLKLTNSAVGCNVVHTAAFVSRIRHDDS